MLKLLAFLCSQLLLISGCGAVTWDIVTVSASVKQGGTGNITTTILSARDYLNLVSTTTGTPKSDLFVGFREDNGQLAVVRISDETVLYNIVSGIATAGNASNGTNTKFSIGAQATVSSLNTDFQGFIYDGVTRFPNGSIKQVVRLFIGGAGNQTIKGLARTTGKKIEL
jgi:hypothetical protein